MSSLPPSHEPDTPDPLLAEYIARVGSGEIVDIDELCRANPKHAVTLRSLHEQVERAKKSLKLTGKEPGPETSAQRNVPAAPASPGSFAARLKKKYGEGVDPEVSLDEGPGVSGAASAPSSPSSAPTDELVRRLAQHGLKESRYKLEGELARGGMGAILRVWDEDLRRHLAMKVILGKTESPSKGGTPPVDSRQLARFLEEAQVTGQLDHPGIVPVHELGLDSDGRVYFTMKLVKGRDLKKIFDLVFEEKEGWNETRALGLILRVCEAMAYAHAKGVIHRDLKPANVMVGNFGEVYVMDWGLARVLGRKDTHDIRLKPEFSTSLHSVATERREEREVTPDSPLITMDGDVMGTPAYMSPEQARGEIEKLSARSDVYSLGALLYHLLTGEVPYVPKDAKVSARTLLMRVIEGPPKRLHEIRRDVPAELVAICEKAMSRDAAKRYPNTLALAEDLKAYLEGRVVRAYETGAVAELRKWVMRNKGIAAASAAALLIAISGLAWNSYIQSAATRNIEAKNQELHLTVLSLDEQRTLAQHKEEAATRQSYVANIIAADASLRANEIAEVKRRLAACDERLRGWEWRYLHLAVDSSIRVLHGHEDIIFSFVFSPDGSRIASASKDKTVRVWSVASGENLLVLRGHDSEVEAVTFSSDGSRIASASDDGTVRVWGAITGEQLLVLRGHAADVAGVAFSPDSTRIASASIDKTVRIWDARDGTSLYVLRGDDGFKSVSFSPDGSRIASISQDVTVHVWDTNSGKRLLVLRGHDSENIFSVVFSPDGSRIASASEDKTIRVWSVHSGEALFVLRGHDDGVNSVVFSPDGSRLASASDDSTVRVWDGRDGKCLFVLRGHDGLEHVLKPLLVCHRICSLMVHGQGLFRRARRSVEAHRAFVAA